MCEEEQLSTYQNFCDLMGAMITFKAFSILSLLTFSVCCSPILLEAAKEHPEKELYLVAQKAFDDGFYDVAMRYINEFLQKYPQNEKRIEAKLLLGQCYFFLTEYLKAYNVFQELLEYPDYKDVTLFWMGETYLKGQDFANAQKNYQQLIELFPTSTYTPQAYYSLAWSYFEQKNYDQAIHEFLNLTIKFPANTLTEDASFKLGECAYNALKYEEAINYFKSYVLRYPQSTRHDQAYFYTAEANYYLEQYPQAIEYYSKAKELAKDPKLSVMSTVSLGWCYLKNKDMVLAQKSFDESLVLAQQKGLMQDDIYLGKATLYSETKDDDKALEAYQNLITQFPNSNRLAEAYLGKANSLYALKRFSEAVDVYRDITTKFSSDPQSREIVEKAQFGLAWTFLKEGKIDESITIFQSILDNAQNKTIKVSALTQIADAYQDTGELMKALDVYDKVLRDYPDSLYTDYVQFRQGVVLLKSEKIEAAILSLKSLKANFPNSQYLNDVDYYLGVAAFKKSDWSGCVQSIESFLKEEKRSLELNSQAYYVLASAFFNMKEFSKAKDSFENIVKQFPDQQELVIDAEINIAKCLYQLGQKETALSQFQDIVAKYPQSIAAQESLLWLGDTYQEAGDLALAIAAYQKIISQYPQGEKVIQARYHLGQALVTQEDFQKALVQFQLVSLSEDKTLAAKAELAIAEIFSKELNPDKALVAYQQIVDGSPDFKRDALLKIAQIQRDDQKYNEAITAYTQALQSEIGLSSASDALIQFEIAETYELFNQMEKAVDSYLKIAYVYSKEQAWVIKAYLRAGRIFEDKPDWENARSVYHKLINLKVEESKFAQERLDWIKDNIKSF